MTPSSLNQDADVELISAVVHEALRAFVDEIGEPPLPPWTEAPEWMRSATLDGVRFRLENPYAPSSAQHDQWMREKLEGGWRYGPTKDEAAKTHPSLLPYAELSETEKRKDALFAAIVSALAGNPTDDEL